MKKTTSLGWLRTATPLLLALALTTCLFTGTAFAAEGDAADSNTPAPQAVTESIGTETDIPRTRSSLLPTAEDVTLPEKPLTAKDFAEVFKWMAVNGETTVTLSYPGMLFSDTYCEFYFNYVHAGLYRLDHDCPELTAHRGGYGIGVITEVHDRKFETTFTITWEYKDNGKLREQEALEKAEAVLADLYAAGELSCEVSEYERAKVLLDWIVDNVEYDYSAEDCHTGWGALCRGRAVCDGYTAAYNMLLKLDGIKCRGQHGYAFGNNDPSGFNGAGNHLWTVAVLDGQEVQIDSTWCDSGWGLKYFAISEQEMSWDHWALSEWWGIL